MPINLIANVAVYQNKLAIGYNDNLLFNIYEDMQFFKKITSDKVNNIANIILMGYSTYKSISEKNRPLSNRINLVLTNNKDLNTKNFLKINLHDMTDKSPYYINMRQFIQFYTTKSDNKNVFVIGGSTIYNYFLDEKCIPALKPSKLFISHVINPNFKKITNGNIPNKFMTNFTNDYTLISYSAILGSSYKFRILTYNALHPTLQEDKYFQLIKSILDNNQIRTNRTDTSTVSIFGAKMEFNISHGIPMMTTRQIPFKAIVEELLWFCRGDTCANILKQRGVNIWNGNTTREFLDNVGLRHYPEGVLGAGYGHQLRNFGAEYNAEYADSSKIIEPLGGFDQLDYVVNLLKTDPFSRRIVISMWNPPDLSKVALAPCHITVQFYVEEINNIKHLSCQFMMRSSDSLAWSYNVCSYAILTYIIAMKTGMKPYKIIYIAGDTHIYTNHIEQLSEQMSRPYRPEPKLYLDPSIATKDWKDIQFTDFELVGYFPHKALPFPMAI